MSYQGKNTVTGTIQRWDGSAWIEVAGILITEPGGQPQIAAAGGGTLTLGPYLQADQATVPSTPTNGSHMYTWDRANRSMPSWVEPTGRAYQVQEFLGAGCASIWRPPGNSTQTPGIFGHPPVSTYGSPSSRDCYAGNFMTRQKRFGVVSGTGANSSAGIRVGAEQITTGTGTLGGFFKVVRFGISDPVLVTDATMFVGIAPGGTFAGGLDPSSIINCFGVGRRSGDTNMHLFWGGSVAQTPVDLGAAFPSNSLTASYEITLACPPSGAGTLYYELINLETNATTGPQSVSGVVGTATPASSTFISENQVYRSTVAGGAAVGIDILSCYCVGNN